MFKNYLVTAMRNLLRHKVYSLINIGGLALGLAAAILILLFVRDEFSWDRWVPNAEHIFRVELKSYPVGREEIHLAASFTPMAPFYAQSFREVERVTRLRYEARTVKHKGQYFAEEPAFVDPNFLDVFQLDMLEESREQALLDPSSAAISRSLARKYFGGGPAVGQTLTFNNGNSYRVAAVFEDIPAGSHFSLDIILPLNYAEFPERVGSPSLLDDWFNLGTYVYLSLDDPRSSETVQAGLPQLLDDYGPRPNDSIVPSERWKLQLINIRDIHLDGAPRARIKPAGSRSGAIVFASIALLILLIGCLNFINLSTAKATLRAREVAVRKVFGANRRQLVVQFLFEIGLVVLVALCIALLLVEAALPWYNVFVQKVLALDLMRDPSALLGLGALLLIVVLGAGSHPALTISAFRPVEFLHSGHSRSARSTRLRSVLVGVQFAIAIILMISSVVVYSQVRHGLQREKGFQSESIMFLGKLNDPTVASKANTLKERLLAHPDITSASLSSATPVDHFTSLVGYGTINGESVEPVIVNYMSIDADFFESYQVDLLAGRDFEHDRLVDYSRVEEGEYRDSSIILSESAVRKLGLGSPENALGATLVDGSTVTVIGVVADILNGSAKEEARPYVYLVDEPEFRRLSLRFETSNLPALQADVENIWAEVIPEIPVQANILQNQIEALFEDEKSRGLMFAVFAGLAIVIASLGLYGMSSFTIEQRSKEIGMRKVLGASITNIVRHFVWQTSKPIVWANLVAWPVAWWFMSDWLNHFTYRIELTAWPFLIAAGLAMLIGGGSVIGQVWMAARAKPINSLRFE